MKDEVQAILERPFDKQYIKQRTQVGKKLDYIEAHNVIHRLNEAFGPTDWSFSIGETIQTVDEYIVFGTMCVEMVCKSQVGSAQIMYKKGTEHVPENMVGLGDNIKSAISDCIKKCATLFGVALHLYGAVEGHSTPPQKPKSGAQEQRMPSTGNRASTYDGKLHTAVKELEKDIMVATGMSQNELRIKLTGSKGLNTSDAEAMKVYKGLLENEKETDSDE